MMAVTINDRDSDALHSTCRYIFPSSRYSVYAHEGEYKGYCPKCNAYFPLGEFEFWPRLKSYSSCV